MDWLLTPDNTAGKLLVMVVAIALFVVVMSVILLFIDRVKRPPTWLVVAGFLGPALLALAFGLVYPGLRTIWSSLFDRSGEMVGLGNYVTAITQDEFQRVLLNTGIWVLLVPSVATAIGLLYAVLVDRTRFESFAKTLVFLPMAISMVGASIIWKFVYEYRPDQAGVSQIGLLNQFLVWLGFEPQQLLLTWPGNTFFLLVVMIWIQAGFAMTVLSAAIKAIPDDIIEAARLDGVGGIRMFRFVTVPTIRPAIVVVAATIAMGTLKIFDIVRTMTGGRFGTSVVANEFYTQQFSQRNTGMAATLAVILFILVIPLVIYNIRQMRLAEDVR